MMTEKGKRDRPACPASLLLPPLLAFLADLFRRPFATLLPRSDHPRELSEPRFENVKGDVSFCLVSFCHVSSPRRCLFCLLDRNLHRSTHVNVDSTAFCPIDQLLRLKLGIEFFRS